LQRGREEGRQIGSQANPLTYNPPSLDLYDHYSTSFKFIQHTQQLNMTQDASAEKELFELIGFLGDATRQDVSK